MKEITITSTMTIYENMEELPSDIHELMLQAIEARKQAYSPYSNFKVGAAIKLDNGVVVTGSNQENAAYPSGLCAERVAIYYAGAQYPDAKIESMALTAASDKHVVDEPVSSCGACRQAIAEYEIKQNQPIAIYFMGETGSIMKSNSLKDLLPLIFDKEYL